MNKRLTDLYEQAAFETEYDDVQDLKELVNRFAELLVSETISEFTDQLNKTTSIPANRAYFEAVDETEKILLK